MRPFHSAYPEQSAQTDLSTGPTRQSEENARKLWAEGERLSALLILTAGITPIAAHSLHFVEYCARGFADSDPQL
jgi:hypothetical protein